MTGIDIYPADLPEQPDNLELEMYNLNAGLLGYYRPSHYDLIHSRFVGPGIHKNRWRSYVGELNRLLIPGGWLQMVEYYYCFQSDNGLLTEAHALRRWWAAYAYAMAADRDPRASIHLRDLMQSAGFVGRADDDVQLADWRLARWYGVSLACIRFHFGFPSSCRSCPSRQGRVGVLMSSHTSLLPCPNWWWLGYAVQPPLFAG